MSERPSKLLRSSLTYDDMVLHGRTDSLNPSWWVDPDNGFFVISFGRYREFGFCCGRMRWSYREAQDMMRKVAATLREFRAELLG